MTKCFVIKTTYPVSLLQVLGQRATHTDATLDRGRTEVRLAHLSP
jgi:hypothetical protein